LGLIKSGAWIGEQNVSSELLSITRFHEVFGVQYFCTGTYRNLFVKRSREIELEVNLLSKRVTFSNLPGYELF
jgi:hypothetical protein